MNTRYHVDPESFKATPRNIRFALLSGYEPEELPGAVRIGGGSEKSAYRVGEFIVKLFDGAFSDGRTFPPARYMRKLGVKLPKMWIVERKTARIDTWNGRTYLDTRRYVIQRQYAVLGKVINGNDPRFSPEESDEFADLFFHYVDEIRSERYSCDAQPYDLHANNIGIGRDGKTLVAFDW